MYFESIHGCDGGFDFEYGGIDVGIGDGCCGVDDFGVTDKVVEVGCIEKCGSDGCSGDFVCKEFGIGHEGSGEYVGVEVLCKAKDFAVFHVMDVIGCEVDGCLKCCKAIVDGVIEGFGEYVGPLVSELVA